MADNGTPAGGGAARTPRTGTPEAGIWIVHFIALFLGAGGALVFSSLSGLLQAALGTTNAAAGTVAAAILAALAAGLLLAGRSRGGPFLIVSAFALLLSPWVLPSLAPAGGFLFRLGEGSPLLLCLFRFALALPLAVLPAGCLGAGFAAVTREAGWGGHDRFSRALRVAVLAAGAALGAVYAGFYLLPWGGETAVATAGALLLFGAAVLSGMARRETGTSGERPAQSPPGDGGGSLVGWGGLFWGIAVAAALPAWDRILSLTFGPFPESASRTWGIFLLGCALGALATMAGDEPRRAGGTGIAWIAALAGIATLLSLHLVNRLPLAYLTLASLAGTAPFSFSLKSWGVGMLLLLPAGIAFGALLPLLAAPAPGGEGKRDEGSGGSWLVPVLAGALLGSVAARAGIVPLFGFRSLLLAASALILAFSGAAFAFAGGRPRLARAAGILLVLLATLFLAVRGIPGDPRLLASGVHRYAREILREFKDDPATYRAARLDTKFSYFREGREMTVAVERQEADVSPILALTADGAVAGTTYYDLVPQILAGEIPMVMHPAAKDVFLIGYGTGIPAGSILLHPVRSLVVAEEDPAVIEASRQFEPANRTPRADSRTRIRFGDPRLVLRSMDRSSLDLILVRDTQPEGAAARFQLTRRFYSLCASRLRAGGLFAQVLPLQGLSPADLASVVRTVRSVFADAMLLQTYYGELLLLASDSALRFDLPGMQAAMDQDRVKSDLGRIGLPDAASLVVRYRLAGKGLEAFARGGRILTDRGAPLTWAGYRLGVPEIGTATLDAVERHSTGIVLRIAGLKEGAEGNAQLLDLARTAISAGDSNRAADLAEALAGRGDRTDAHEILGDAHYLRMEQIEAVKEWHLALDADPKNVNALESLAGYSSDRQNYEAAEEYLRKALEVKPGDPGLLFAHGRALYYLKRPKESEAELVKVLSAKGETGAPLALYYLGLIQKEKNNLTGAAEFLRRYLQWAYGQGRLTAVEADVHMALADIYQGMNLPDLAEKQKKAGEVLQEKLKEMAKMKEKAVMEMLGKP